MKLPPQNLPECALPAGEFSGYYTINVTRTANKRSSHHEILAEELDSGANIGEPWSYLEPNLSSTGTVRLIVEDFWHVNESIWGDPTNAPYLIVRAHIKKIIAEAAIAPTTYMIPCVFRKQSNLLNQQEDYYLLYGEDLGDIDVSLPEVYDLKGGEFGEIFTQEYMQNPFQIEYLSKSNKKVGKYDIFVDSGYAIMFSETLAFKLIEFDSELQFDPVLFPAA